MRFLWLIPIAAVIGLDQLTKYLAVLHLKPINTHPIIEGVLHLTYVENRGAAFGMLKNHRWIFMIISTVAIIAVIAFMLAAYKKQYYSPVLFLGLGLIAGGGIGNMIDRFLVGYVVDFIDVRLINFAVFNVADIFVCAGCAIVFLKIILDDIAESRKNKTGDHSS